MDLTVSHFRVADAQFTQAQSQTKANMTTLNFPSNVDPKDLLSTGRNGCMYIQALEIAELHDRVLLSPVNSKGNAGHCHISIPLDKEYLLQLVGELTKIADAI